MPVPAPDGVMDEPEAGWPWQLKHCWVLDVKGTGNSLKYKARPTSTVSVALPLSREPSACRSQKRAFGRWEFISQLVYVYYGQLRDYVWSGPNGAPTRGPRVGQT